ncbi:class I SAM-dependent methyltransferase [Tissierella praeacuta]|uniref:methyltransferase n=1 Tax=Tissierella praeacuta TaxID=43131 RepID=UPI003511DE92
MDELLAKAREEVKEVAFFKGCIESNKNVIDIKFDIVFMNGVHSIFDDIRPVLNNIVNLLKEGGRAYVFGIFNPDPIDVIIRSRKSNCNGDWEKGWNLFSINTVSSYLTELGLNHNFKEFKIGIDIHKNILDPLRSWTINMGTGEKGIINGLQLLHPFYLLEIINE